MDYVLSENETAKYIKKVKKLLKEIPYITLSTVDENCNPLSSPINSAYDDNFNFYWKSPTDCQHSRNIVSNGKVYWVLFDSRVAVGMGIGIYFKGKAIQLDENLDEIQKGSDLIAKRVGKIGSLAMKFIRFKPRRVYKAIPEEIWINTVRIKNFEGIDGKIKITLDQLKKY